MPNEMPRGRGPPSSMPMTGQPTLDDLCMPPLTVFLGPAGAGKTRACLERFRAARGRALFLVPSTEHAERIHMRMLAEGITPRDGTVWTFGRFMSFVAGVGPGGKTIRHTFQHLALAGIVERETGPEDFFGRMRGTPGFIGELAETVRALKLSGVAPQELETGIEAVAGRVDDPSFPQKAGEIARLYRAYESHLRENSLRDEEDLAGIATERLTAGADLPHGARVVLVDGFYRLSQAWRGLLEALARRGVEVAVTLPYEAPRPLLFATPARTLDTLRAGFAVREVVLSIPSPGSRPDPLYMLERGLFEGARRVDGAPTVYLTTEDTEGRGEDTGFGSQDSGTSAEACALRLAPCDSPVTPSPLPPFTPSSPPAVSLFDAPNPYAEAEMVARALRREHDERDVPWDRCAIVLRSVEEYAPTLAAVCERYEIPLAIRKGRVVGEHPLVKTLVTLFNVFLRDWQRDDVIAFLKSSYTAADRLRADGLHVFAKRRGLREGRENWERLADGLRKKGDPLAGILDAMLEADGNLAGRHCTADEFTAAVDSLLTSVGIAPERREDTCKSPDEYALEQAKNVLDDIGFAMRLRGRGPMRFAEYYREVLAGWQAAVYSPPPDPHAVAVIEPYDAETRDARFVVVMGLTERVFPRRVMEDPFFRDEERAALSTVGVPLEEQRERADDERLLFYMAVTAPREHLVLSYPRSDDESDTLRSFYVDEAQDALGHLPAETRTLADVAPRPEECVNERDRRLAACLHDSPGHGSASSDWRSATSDSALLPRWPHLEAGELQRDYAAPRRYAITEIECYNLCPFKHLMQHGLGLRPETDGAGPADRGTMLHAVLRRCFRRRAEKPDPPTAEELRAALAEEMEACLEEMAVDARPYRRRMMQRALVDTLDGFAAREVRYRDLFGMSPAHFELAFGLDGEAMPGDDEIAADAQRDYDPASTSLPLVLQAGDGGAPIHLCGAMDRVDLAPDGRRALALDYKLGNAVPFPTIKEGRSLQLPLYLMALEKLFGKVGAVACYDSPRDRGRRRFFRTEHAPVKQFGLVAGAEAGEEVKPVSPGEFVETMKAARASVRRAVAGISAADIAPTPGDHCRWCDYADVCRTLPGGYHDGALPETGIETPAPET